MDVTFDTLVPLAVALGIGLLIGLERGWDQRDAVEGSRVAGIRTFGLLGLLGGVAALLSRTTGPLTLGLFFIGLTGLLAVAYLQRAARAGDVGLTSLAAALLAFALGALAVAGELVLASASAVVVTGLLSGKQLIHDTLRKMSAGELRAALKLLLISVVVLPVLPDEGFGPWQALNPFEIWMMVVIVATISFSGYFAVRVAGSRRGFAFTGLFGGLASSTAVTLHLSRVCRREPAAATSVAVGILAACGTMMPRMLLVSGIIDPSLLARLAWPAGVMALVTYTPAILAWRAARRPGHGDVDAPMRNPLELRSALAFGALLGGVMLLGEALKRWTGEAGLLALAAASGLSDVDAITLSLARMSARDLALQTAVLGIVIAAATNTGVKAGLAAAIGGRPLLLRVSLPLVLAALAGLMLTLFLDR